MFKDTKDGETQYCLMCAEWAEKYEKLKAENASLRNHITNLLQQFNVLKEVRNADV